MMVPIPGDLRTKIGDITEASSSKKTESLDEKVRRV